MRTLIVGVVAVLAGCGSSEPPGSGSGSDEPDKRVVPNKPPNLPRVDDADVVIAPGQVPQPAAFVWVSQSGKLEVAQVGPTWTGDPPTDRHAVFMPSEIYPEILKAAHNSSDPIRNAARDQALGRRAPGASGGADGKRIAASPLVQLSEAEAIVPVVATAPGAAAAFVVRVLMRAGGILAVRHDRQPAMLKLAAKTSVDRDAPATGWVELHVDSDGIHLVRLPAGLVTEIPWLRSGVDFARLTSELHADVQTDTDVLVGTGVEAQQLVDVLATMRKLGMTRVFLGEQPAGSISDRISAVHNATVDNARVVLGTTAYPYGPTGSLYPGRTGTPPTTTLGLPASQGDLDKAIIRRYVKRNLYKIEYCYEKALLATPTLTGTVQVQFFIAPMGTVANATASGVSAEVADCIAGVIKSIAFPAPRGAGVQVNYPMTFRPAGP